MNPRNVLLVVKDAVSTGALERESNFPKKGHTGKRMCIYIYIFEHVLVDNFQKTMIYDMECSVLIHIKC